MVHSARIPIFLFVSKESTQQTDLALTPRAPRPRAGWGQTCSMGHAGLQWDAKENTSSRQPQFPSPFTPSTLVIGMQFPSSYPQDSWDPSQESYLILHGLNSSILKTNLKSRMSCMLCKIAVDLSI